MKEIVILIVILLIISFCVYCVVQTESSKEEYPAKFSRNQTVRIINTQETVTILDRYFHYHKEVWIYKVRISSTYDVVNFYEFELEE